MGFSGDHRPNSCRTQRRAIHRGDTKSREADACRRDKAQAEYVEDFLGAVLAFLAFYEIYADLADRLARAVTDYATPVGSGTVARTKRIPIEKRAEAAVIAWLRHKTTEYDYMVPPRAGGKRREVTRQHDLFIHDGERHPIDSDLPGLLVRLPDRIHSLIPIQDGLGSLPIQASVRNHIEERLPIVDVPALGEVGQEQCFHNRILHAEFIGQPDQPMCIERVRRSLDPIKSKMDAFCFADRNHVGIEFL